MARDPEGVVQEILMLPGITGRRGNNIQMGSVILLRWVEELWKEWQAQPKAHANFMFDDMAYSREEVQLLRDKLGELRKAEMAKSCGNRASWDMIVVLSHTIALLKLMSDH